MSKSAAPINMQIAPQRAWTGWHVAALLAFVGAAVFAAGEPWRDIWNYAAHDEESSQILLVPVVVAWIVWVRRERLAGCRPENRLPGLLLIALGWLLLSMGNRRQIQSFWHGGAIMLATGGVVTVLGGRIFRRMLPAFGALIFLAPVPSTGRHLLAYPLQQVTAQATQVCGEVLGMTVERTGNLLSINGNNVAIAEACNGMRMVFTLFLVSYTFAFTTPLATHVRILVLLCSPLMAIVCNVVRLVPTVYVYGHYSKGFAQIFHDVSGWVMLLVGYLLLTGIVAVMRWISGQSTAGSRVVVAKRVVA